MENKKGTPEGAPLSYEHNITRLKKLQEKVEYILRKNEKARRNDNYLAGLVYRTFYGLNGDSALLEQEENCVPSVESIGRARRKAQRLKPELRPTEEVSNRRKTAEIEFIEYARS